MVFKKQSKQLMKNLKKSNKLSNASDDTKSFFDLEAKEVGNSSGYDENSEESEKELSDYEECLKTLKKRIH